MQSIPRSARTPVWALSISLAATLEIDVSFSSSAYLDVSVQRVPFIWLCIYHMMTEVLSRVSPFGYRRVTGYLLLTAAFRSLSRPSSALSAKASTLRPFLLNLPSYRSSYDVASFPLDFRLFLNTGVYLRYTIFFSDVLLIINGFIIISLYEVLKVHIPVFSHRVEMRGFEPLTPCLQGRCSPN